MFMCAGEIYISSVLFQGDVVGVRRRHGDWLELVQAVAFYGTVGKGRFKFMKAEVN